MEQSSQSSSIDKALDVLFHLHATPEPCGVTAIARALAMPKGSVHRLLTALMRRGLVERDRQGRYRPGFALIALGLGALEREPLAIAARPVLEEVAVELGETVFLVIARSGRLRVLEKAEGRGLLRVAPQLGAAVPVHATAAGRLYLALAPDAVQLDATPTAYSEHTPVTGDDLAAAIARAGQRGWDCNIDQWIPGMSVVAAPVLVAGRMAAAVTVAMSSARLPDFGVEVLARRLQAAARQISERVEGKQ